MERERRELKTRFDTCEQDLQEIASKAQNALKSTPKFPLDQCRLLEDIVESGDRYRGKLHRCNLALSEKSLLVSPDASKRAFAHLYQLNNELMKLDNGIEFVSAKASLKIFFFPFRQRYVF